MAWTAVELRHRKIGACLAQDLVGLPKLTVLPFQGLQLLGHLSRNAGPLPAVDLGLLDPVMKRPRCAADLGRNRCHRRPARRVLAGVIQNHPNRAAPDLRRKLVRRLACHGSVLSGVRASGKPGTVHFWSVAIPYFVSYLLTLPLAALVIRSAWWIVGGRAPARSFFITYAYYAGVGIVLLNACDLVASGLFK